MGDFVSLKKIFNNLNSHITTASQNFAMHYPFNRLRLISLSIIVKYENTYICTAHAIQQCGLNSAHMQLLFS